MNLDELLKIGAQAFASSVGANGGGVSLERIQQALAGLMPGDGNSVDLQALIAGMQGGGLGALAESWLGDGGNRGIDAGQLLSMFGGERIERFAGQLGVDRDTAVAGLQDAVPEMVDKASSGGTLDALGGVEGLMGMAGKFFS